MEVDNTITYKFQSPKLFLFDSKQKKIAKVSYQTQPNIICILKNKIQTQNDTESLYNKKTTKY